MTASSNMSGRNRQEKPLLKALVLLSHGSRLPESNQEMMALAVSMAALEENPFSEVRCAFLQLARPSFDQVVDDLVHRDIHNIVVMPLFLASGSHVRDDLPEMTRTVASRYPDLKITVTPHLGGTGGLARYLMDNAIESS